MSLTLDTPEKIHNLFKITIDHDYDDLVDLNKMKKLFVDYYDSKQKLSSIKIPKKYTKYFDALITGRNDLIANRSINIDDRSTEHLCDLSVLEGIEKGQYQIQSYEKKFLHDCNKMVCIVTLKSGDVIIDYSFYDVDCLETFISVVELADDLAPRKINGNDKVYLVNVLENQI